MERLFLPFSTSVARPRLLLVEDHAGLADATQEFLQSEGLDVRLASSGREALAAAVAFQPDIVLCDLHLPDMAGLDVLGALRENPAVDHSLLVIHTVSSTAEGDILRAPEADLFLSKPINNKKLVMLLAELQRLRQKMKQ
jgi:CheY-like chemotaxis protein